MMERSDIDGLVSLVQVPSGDAATLRLREDYTERLIAAGAAAQERIERCLFTNDASNVPVLMGVLAAFANERAAAFLSERLHAGSERIAEIAADALAAVNTPWSRAALVDALTGDRPAVVRSALVALRGCDEPVPCPLVTPLLRNADRTIRFHAAHLAASANCFDAQLLRELVRDETDADVLDVLRAQLDTLA